MTPDPSPGPVDPTPARDAARRLWSGADFHRLGVTQQIVGELLVADLHVHAGERVLDVAGGSGNTALAAARRLAVVTCSDLVPGLLEIAAERARAERLTMRCEIADAQALHHADGSFDVVTSTFGAMFARGHQQTADELLRVLRPGGRLGLTAWTPDGFSGAQFALLSEFLPPPPGPPPVAWGTPDHVEQLLGDRVGDVRTQVRHVLLTDHSPEAMFDTWLASAPPLVAAWAAIAEEQRPVLRRRWIELVRRFDVATDGTSEVEAEYLQVLAAKR